jgi:hypothetical protein
MPAAGPDRSSVIESGLGKISADIESFVKRSKASALQAFRRLFENGY